MLPTISLSSARTLHPNASLCLTTGTSIRKITITDMQIRKEDPLGFLQLHFLRTLMVQRSGSVSDFHRLFGIGISLCRVVIRDLLEKKLVNIVRSAPSWWDPTSPEIPTKAIQFHKEEDRRLIPDPIDEKSVTLTPEGQDVAESGKYAPIKIIPEWSCYFTTNPVRFFSLEDLEYILPRSIGDVGKELTWVEDHEAKHSFYIDAFQESNNQSMMMNRDIFGIPYEYKGPRTESSVDEETGFTILRSSIHVEKLGGSANIPVTHVLKSELSRELEVIVSFLPPKFDQSEPYLLPGHIPTSDELFSQKQQAYFMQIGQDNQLWSRAISNKANAPEFTQYIESIEDNGRTQHLFLATVDPEVIDDGLRCAERSIQRLCTIPQLNAALEIDLRLIPGNADIASSWLDLLSDRIRIGNIDSIDRSVLQKMLQDKTEFMKVHWVRHLFPIIENLKPPSVDSYLGKRWDEGNWKFIYQLSFKEDFPDA